MITLNNKKIHTSQNLTILEVCLLNDIQIPRFCYHPELSIAGNCRMCLVSVEGVGKPLASCSTYIKEGMVINTETPEVRKAREDVMELLLINHPLDCPICDQGGECDLQDLAYRYGNHQSHYTDFPKRIVEEKNLGPFIKTAMTRCIHCTRCVRFMKEIAGNPELGMVHRGEDMKLTSYLESNLTSTLSGNIIDVCPVGALIDKPYSYRGRHWELIHTETIDTSDAFCTPIRVDHKDGTILRILPGNHTPWIHDRTRFSHDAYRYQRLDRPYKKVNGKLESCHWDEALLLASKALLSAESPLVLIGPLVDWETIKSAKNLCQYTGQSIERSSYIMNTQDMNDLDALIIIDLNLKQDAPLLLAQLWKIYQNRPFPVALRGPDQDLPFPYQRDESFLLHAKRPVALTMRYYPELPVMHPHWNGHNIIQMSASSVAALDEGIRSLESLETYDVIYLLGVDDRTLDLKDKYIIYQGHHGDYGAECADIILPCAAPFEKSGTYVNAYGHPLKTTSILPIRGEARLDLEILNALTKRKMDLYSHQECYQNFYQRDSISRSSMNMAKALMH